MHFLNDLDESSMLDIGPWEQKATVFKMSDFEIAVTGNAFQLMSDQIKNFKVDSETKEKYKNIIAYAKIYARMSPDHKAMLVTSLQENTKDMIGM